MENSNIDLALGEAAQQCARLAADESSEAQRNELARWRAEHLVNEQAFARVQQALEQVDRAVATDSRLQALAAKALAAGASIPDDGDDEADCAALVPIKGADKKVRRRFAIPLTLAASVLVAATIAIVFSNSVRLSSESELAVRKVMTGSPRSTTQLILTDGTVAHLDVGAQIAVDIKSHERRIELLAGRAFFEVAHDASRPFIVSANGVQTIALGTKFEVKKDVEDTTVTLVEGSVAVSDTKSPAVWSEKLVPGDQVQVARATHQPIRHQIDAFGATSWSRGWLVYENATLGFALSEMNRYSNKQIVLGDSSLADLRIAGQFVAGDNETIAASLAEALPVRVVDGGSRELILFRRYDN